jgi:hypothetical protein
MFFKPRIFLSSTLSENLSIRSEIENFFISIGAEPMLYEKNLTPSVNSMTYRKDITDADFIIFIIKDNYGVRTERGVSGTHEEFQIALETNIPKHVYIKLDAGKKDARELIEDINNNQISYYYFEKDEDLLKRIKETTFTIAKEIMLKKVEGARLPKESVKRISFKYDYEKAIEIIKIIESMKKIAFNYEYDFVYTTIFTDFIDPIKIEKNYRKWFFIDGKIENILDEMICIYNKFDTHCIDFTSIPGAFKEVKVPVLGEVTIYKCTSTNYPKRNNSEYVKIIEDFMEKYNRFREYIGNMKLVVDTIV